MSQREPTELNPSMSVGDMVYVILSRHGKPLHYKQLIDEVLNVRPVQQGEDLAKVAARIHTEINLDNRFIHMGQGVWGLRRWAPRHQEGRVATLLPGGGSRRIYEDEEDTRYDELDLIDADDRGKEENDWDAE